MNLSTKQTIHSVGKLRLYDFCYDMSCIWYEHVCFGLQAMSYWCRYFSNISKPNRSKPVETTILAATDKFLTESETNHTRHHNLIRYFRFNEIMFGKRSCIQGGKPERRGSRSIFNNNFSGVRVHVHKCWFVAWHKMHIALINTIPTITKNE